MRPVAAMPACVPAAVHALASLLGIIWDTMGSYGRQLNGGLELDRINMQTASPSDFPQGARPAAVVGGSGSSKLTTQSVAAHDIPSIRSASDGNAMRLTIGRRIQVLVLMSAISAALLGGGAWIALERFSTIQDKGMEIAHHAIDATEASGLGARLYRIIADAEINRDLADTDKQWSIAEQSEHSLIARIETWVEADAERAALQTAKTSLNELHTYFTSKMLPILKTSQGVSVEMQKMDGEVDEIVEVVVTAFSKLKELALAKSQQVNTAFDSAISTTMLYGGIAASVLILGLLVVGLSVSRSISSPIVRLDAAMRQMADGHLDVRIPD
eukprot:gene20017-20544_t